MSRQLQYLIQPVNTRLVHVIISSCEHTMTKSWSLETRLPSLELSSFPDPLRFVERSLGTRLRSSECLL